VVRNRLNIGIGIKLQDQKVIKLVVYADDIVILAKSIEGFQITTRVLIQDSKQIGITYK